jgi:hypothetical protein
MIKIEWENHLSADHLRKSDDELLDKNENWIGKKLPSSLREMIKEHGGQTPLNLIPKTPKGKKLYIECIYHAYFEDETYDGYTIPFATSALEDDDYLNYIAFSNVGNIYWCLDYNIREIEPPVILLIRDYTPNDPDHRILLADTFNEFLEKYTVPMDQVE